MIINPLENNLPSKWSEKTIDSRRGKNLESRKKKKEKKNLFIHIPQSRETRTKGERRNYSRSSVYIPIPRETFLKIQRLLHSKDSTNETAPSRNLPENSWRCCTCRSRNVCRVCWKMLEIFPRVTRRLPTMATQPVEVLRRARLRRRVRKHSSLALECLNGW